MLITTDHDVHFVTDRFGAFQLRAGDTREVPDKLGEVAVEFFGCRAVEADAGDKPGGTEDADKDAVRAAVQAILEEGNPEHFTKNGVPRLDIVRERLEGQRVTRAMLLEVFTELMADGDDGG